MSINASKSHSVWLINLKSISNLSLAQANRVMASEPKNHCDSTISSLSLTGRFSVFTKVKDPLVEAIKIHSGYTFVHYVRNYTNSSQYTSHSIYDVK